PPQCPPGSHWDGTQCVPDVKPPPQCPPGSHWDGQQCVPDTIGIVLPPFEGPPPDDGSQDELSQVGQCLCSGLNWIIAFIQQVAQQQPDPCCNNLIASIQNLSVNLLAVFNQLAQPEPVEQPPDFSGIVAELQCICAQMQAAPSFALGWVSYLGNQLAAIAS